MSKFSVKKPFTVLVAVIAAITLGFVSLSKLQLDLLPEISLPYLIVITTYPGASAEKVEEEVCKPMEDALGTINGVENIYSICNENYGMVELEFQDGTDLDSAMVKVSSALNTLESYLPDDCGTPSIMEIGTNLMASIYLAVSMEGMSADELSEFFILHAETETSDGIIKHEAVIRIATEGLPEDRDTAIYRSIIKNKRDFVKFLELMLTDSPVQFISSVETEREIGTKGNGAEELVYSHIYEQMLRTAATNPNQIFQIGKVLEKLDKTESVPEEFRKIYKQFANAIK